MVKRKIIECDVCGGEDEYEGNDFGKCMSCGADTCDMHTVDCNNSDCDNTVCNECCLCDDEDGTDYCPDCFPPKKKKKQKIESDESDYTEDEDQEEVSSSCSEIESDDESDCGWIAEGLLHYKDGHVSPDGSDEEKYYVCLDCSKKKESKDAECLCKEPDWVAMADELIKKNNMKIKEEEKCISCDKPYTEINPRCFFQGEDYCDECVDKFEKEGEEEDKKDETPDQKTD